MKRVLLILVCNVFFIVALFSQDAVSENFNETESSTDQTVEQTAEQAIDQTVEQVAEQTVVPTVEINESTTEISNPIETEEQLEVEKKQFEAENSKRNEAIAKIIEQIVDAEYFLETKDDRTFKTSKTLYLANGLSKFEPFKTYRSGRWESYYVLNKASIKSGLEPVYSVDGETNPELWNVERKSSKTIPDINENANGFRRNEYQYDWHFTVSYIPGEDEIRIEEEKIKRRSQTDSGKAYLDLLGMDFKLIDGEGKNLLVKKTAENKSGTVTVDKNFKIFEITVEKKSMAHIYGFREGDILIVDSSDNNLSSKIIIDKEIFDLGRLGNDVVLDDLYGIFHDAKTAKKVSIQLRRPTKKGYEQKEITIKN